MSRESRQLMKQNNRREKQVLPENEDVLTDMICYLKGSELSEWNQEKVREDLLEMIIDGQNRGEDIHQVIGPNVKQICDEIIEELPKKSKAEKVMELFEMVLVEFGIVGCIILSTQLLTQLIKGSFSWNCDITTGDILAVIICILAAHFIWHFLIHDLFSNNKVKQNHPRISDLQLWLIIVGFSATVMLSMHFLNTILFHIHAAIAFTVFAIAFIGSIALSRKY